MLPNPIAAVLFRAVFALALLVPVVGARAEDDKPPSDGPPGRNNHSGLVDRMMAFDKKGDGKLTRDEITDRRFLKLFDRADTNQDGVVTREELEVLAAQLNARQGPDGPGGPPPDAGQGGRHRGGPGSGPGPGEMGPPPQGPPDGPGGPNGPNDAGGPPPDYGPGPGGFGPPPPGPPGGQHGRGPGGPPPQGPPGGPDGQDGPGAFGPPPQGGPGGPPIGPDGQNGPGGPPMYRHRGGRQQGGPGGPPIPGQQDPPNGPQGGPDGADSQKAPAASDAPADPQGNTAAVNADLSKLPPAAQTANVTFAKDIRPLLQASCMRCHGNGRVKGGLQLDSLNGVLAGGEDGKVLIAGDSKDSPLVIAVAQINDDTAMPPKCGPRGGQGGRGGAARSLTAEQVSLVRAWIDQGAK